MKKLLLHQCCGPCSLFPLKTLKSVGFDVTGFFYNPNIHPISELYKRLENTLVVNNYYRIKSIFDETYGLYDFFQFKNADKKKRCFFCYEIRIKKTAEFAQLNGFDCFTSTLLYSKYQDHDKIVELGYRYSDHFGIEFYYYDFRSGWKEGISLSKELGIYRQQYCGCIYSEEERYKEQLSREVGKKWGSG